VVHLGLHRTTQEVTNPSQVSDHLEQPIPKEATLKVEGSHSLKRAQDIPQGQPSHQHPTQDKAPLQVDLLFGIAASK
jgi:hypothetical protein